MLQFTFLLFLSCRVSWCRIWIHFIQKWKSYQKLAMRGQNVSPLQAQWPISGVPWICSSSLYKWWCLFNEFLGVGEQEQLPGMYHRLGSEGESNEQQWGKRWGRKNLFKKKGSLNASFLTSSPSKPGNRVLFCLLPSTWGYSLLYLINTIGKKTVRFLN